jgi:fatty-acyl-CoA synthase
MKHTMSYTSGSSDTPLLGITIGDLFDQSVARYGDNEALIVCHQSIRYTYSQLKAQVDRCARALMALGAQKGDRVGIWAPNCAEWTIVQLAAAKIGAILVNVNPAYRLHEVEYALSQSGSPTSSSRRSSRPQTIRRWSTIWRPS